MIRLHEFEREFILSDGLCVNLKTFSCRFFVLFCEESRLSMIVIPMERHISRNLAMPVFLFFFWPTNLCLESCCPRMIPFTEKL